MSFAGQLAATKRSINREAAASHVGEALAALKRAQPPLSLEDSTGHAAGVATIVASLETIFTDLEAAWLHQFPRSDEITADG